MIAPFNERKSKANILIHFNKPYFFLGTFIEGIIEINSGSSGLIKDIIIEILLYEEWNFKEGEKNKIENNRKKVATYQIDLNKIQILKKVDEDNFLLPIGINFIPFYFLFSEINTPCFEFPLPDKRAFIRYFLYTRISSQDIAGSATAAIYFLARPIIKENKILSLTVKQTIKKWALIEGGNTVLKVSIPDDNYKYNSICKLDIEIDNTKGKISIKEYKVTLIRIIKYKNINNIEKHQNITKIVRETVKAEVKPGQKKHFNYNLEFKEKNVLKTYNYNMKANPYNINIKEINFYMPTVHGSLTDCDYNIKVCLYFENFVDKNHRPRVEMPVYLVHQLPKDYQLEKNNAQIGPEGSLKSNFEGKKNVQILPKLINNQINNFNNNFNNDSLPKQNIENVNQQKKQNEILNNELNINNNQNKNNDENNKNDNQNINNFVKNKEDNINGDYDAPVPFGLNQYNNNISNYINNNNNFDIKENNQNIINNNIYPNLDDNNININENNNNKNNNYENNNNDNNNLNKSDDDDFCLFTQDNQPNDLNNQNEQQNKYEDINAI